MQVNKLFPTLTATKHMRCVRVDVCMCVCLCVGVFVCECCVFVWHIWQL